MIEVGVVGFGWSGRVFHSPLISSVEGLHLAAVVERHSQEAASRYPGIRTFSSLEEMLADPALGLVVLATPSGAHFEMGRQILKAGKHLVIDKPMAAHAGEIAELIALAKSRRLQLIPFHNRRWDADFLTLRKLLAEGSLGRLVHFSSNFDRWRPVANPAKAWKQDPAHGGILLDLGTHLVDQALPLFGKPLAISAEIRSERISDQANDSFALRLRYDELIVELGANTLAAFPRPRFLLRGTKGNFIKNGLDPQEEALSKITRIDNARWGEESTKSWGLLAVDLSGNMVTQPVPSFAGDYRLFYSGVRETLNNASPAPVTAIEAWRVARLLEWARESSAQRREISCDWSEEAQL